MPFRWNTGTWIWDELKRRKPVSDPLVNITVTSYNRLASTRRCLESLQGTSGIAYTLTVVDNASADGSVEYLQELLAAGRIDRLLLCRRNAGVSVAANLGWAAVDTPYYVKLDNDVELLRDDWLTTLVSLVENAPDTGTMGYYIEDERPESSRGPSFAVAHSVGSCILIPRRVHEQLGFWNEEYGLYGIEDSDFSTRIATAGLTSRYAAYSERYIRHWHQPYRDNTELDRAIRVTHGVSDEYTAVFYFNNALFGAGVRPVYVDRKYLPVLKDGVYSFAPNPEYLKRDARFVQEREAFVAAYLESVRAAEAGGDDS